MADCANHADFFTNTFNLYYTDSQAFIFTFVCLSFSIHHSPFIIALLLSQIRIFFAKNFPFDE